MRELVLEGGTVVDVTTGGTRRADVHIRDGVIAQIGGDGRIATESADARRIDVTGRFLLPGLINMHTHFALVLPGAEGDRIRAMGPFDLALHMADGARKTLFEGVTTVRCVAEPDGADFALRRAIESGAAAGPRILTAGRALVCTGGHGWEGDDTLECDGADGFARGVRSQLREGADLVKVMISGGILGEHERIDTPQLRDAELDAVMEVAHAWGRKVTAHAGPAEAIARAVERGLDCVEHGYELTPEVAQLMAARGTALVPTLGVTRCEDFFEQLGVPEWMRQRSLGAADRHVASYRMALDAGVEVMLGSDLPPFWPLDGTNATVREVEHMSDFGLGPVGALGAATIAPARWLGIDGETGSIEVGKVADLIVVDADPTRDIRALRGLRLVVARGDVVRDEG